MPFTSVDRLHSSPFSTPAVPGSWLQAPIRMLAVPVSAEMGETCVRVIVGLLVRPRKTCATDWYQWISDPSCRPAQYEMSRLPGSPTTMCGSTLPGPPPGTTVTGLLHEVRSGPAHVYLSGAPS